MSCFCVFQDFPWYPKPLNELTQMSAVQLNENVCLILFTGNLLFTANLNGVSLDSLVYKTYFSREKEKKKNVLVKLLESLWSRFESRLVNTFGRNFF